MSNEEQFEFWNGEAGQHWAREDDTMARLLHPVSAALLEHAQVQGSRSALDVGCGGGSQSLMLAQALGTGASVLGVDISAPMLEVARQKCDHDRKDIATLSFLQADAAQHDFDAGSFDLLFSRFGVMFFDDPTGAFSNMRKALRPGARLAFCCWQSMPDNDWVRLPLQAALQHLPPPEPPAPDAPGPFAFANPERVEAILHDSGFAAVQLESFHPSMSFAPSSSLAETVREMAAMGPLSKLLEGQDEAVLERVFASQEEALAHYYKDNILSLPGAVWFVTATTG